jgi:hypothetical protein
MAIHLRAVDGFVAAGRPASSLRQATSVIRIANINPAVGSLLLEMAFKTEGRVSFRQHSLID